ncbi:hypothetical protein HDU82_003920 [Entophlyctis luteolus]|nr:hypothetical protein HDU82_003920 [Entophlyctis luteolus]
MQTTFPVRLVDPAASPAHPNSCLRCPAPAPFFPSPRDLRIHERLLHASCNLCLFEGERSKLAQHYAADHPGKPFVPTADPVDEDPAEIAAYIAERRRRFPSRENIRKKLEEEQQKHQKRQKLNSGFASTDSVGKINGINGKADALNHDDNGDRSSFLDKDDIEEDGNSNAEVGEDEQASRFIKKKSFPCRFYAQGKCSNV